MASGASVLAEWPSQTLFKFPPGSEPFGAVPPAPRPGANLFEFTIPDHIWAAALDPKVPITIAVTYAVTVKLLNRYNTSNGKKPWWFANTAPFRLFVILHNVFLAVYSAWTFWGMLGGMRRAVVSPFGPHGLAATADSLCQLNGPAGYGAAAVYDESSARWTSLFADVAVEAAGQPSRDVPGRLWNEGLAFYGWIFYLSKFYEVLDTFIILAKGKQSSTLQTYHHAGAMMCMWAGMRYMSAPIWMFVLYNSFIHSLMYTYYTVTAFNIRVPTPIKRTLTTMQITQFLIGASYAMLHSFVSYTVPVAVNPAAAAATQAATSSSPDAARTLAAGAFENLKQMIYGAAAKAASPAAGAAVEAGLPTDAETVWVSQPCITTSAETFAIWLNVLYLAPLTYLFVMFFIRSYLRRSSAAVKGKPRRQSNVTLAEKAGWDAARDVNREIYNQGSEEAVEAGSSAKPSPKTRTRRSKN
ncbi:GNS1/SUR4 family-domain-containing protein [Plectosphaerella cucumerina]|uniref:Elongation of fatty acids protein n=1 Tax=Plectosphaerella cucumerina TaxID=40658 RepID=A0A8K0T6M5_9PEZI|nr:GNS1/SUR4 family-domain-containing protein [Plectosphaerella cucumerina]